ncbi:MAG: hypothetical protein MJZ53_03680 [Paludibacteraceae bacterium]|nr:hypothetical protein [Paludibacteraceae bacterium]
MRTSKKFHTLQMAMFSRSAKMMSHEMRTKRTSWESQYYEASRKAKRQHRRRFRRVCEYCMHTCYNELVVELTSYLQ